MKKLLITGVFVLAAASMAPNPPSWTTPTAPYKIGDNLYYVGTAGITSLLITTPKGHIIIDGGMPGNEKFIESGIKAMGFKVSDVKIILNSHAHFDHAGGLATLKKDTGAKLYASNGDKAALETGTYPGSEEISEFNFTPVKVDRTINDGQTISLGNVTLTAHITPGHTAGCTTWTFPVKIAGKVRNALYFCSTSVAFNRLVSKTRGPQYPGIIDDYRKSFAKLKTMKADVFLAPHAEQFNMDAKLAKGTPEAFIDPSELQTTVARYEASFIENLAKQEAEAK